MNSFRKIWDMLTDFQLYRTVNLVIYIFYFVSSDYGIDYIPYIVSFFWGIIILINDFFTKRIMFKQPFWFILLAISISYLLSIITNFPANLPNNGMNFLYLTISFFIFYALNPEEEMTVINKKFQKMNDFFIVLTFILGVISLVMFFLNISYVTTEGSRQGFIENRLFGVYTSPNIGSMFGYVSFILMLVNNYFKRGSWKKFQKFYVINSIVMYLYYVLSESRGTRIAMIGFIVILAVLFSIKAFCYRDKRFKKIAINLLIAVGAVVTINNTNQVVKLGLSYTPNIIANLTAPSTEQIVIDEDGNEKTVHVKTPIKKTVIENSSENLEVSSGRFAIWEAGLQLVKQKPLFGVADSYVYRNGELSPQLNEDLLSEAHISELKRVKGNMHNTYIAVLVKAGIVGFILLGLFVILILKDNLFFIVDKSNSFDDESMQIYIIIFSFLLSLFVNDLVENHLIFNNRDAIGLVFWAYLGFTNRFRNEMKNKQTTSI